jgi:hypothetical protein
MTTKTVLRWGALASGLALGAVACNDLSIDLRNPNAATVVLTPAIATIETPADLELDNDQLSSKVIGTMSIGCTLGASNSATQSNSFETPNLVTNGNVAHSNTFTSSSYMRLRSFTLRLVKEGGPSGDMRLQLFASNGAGPTGSVLVTPPDRVIGTSIGTDLLGHLVTFSLASAYEIPAGSYALVLRPQGATVDINNYFSWATVDSSGGCTDFPAYLESANGGGTWTAGLNLGYRRSFFSVTADQHAISGSASWIASVSGRYLWEMATFTFAENPNNRSTGTILYDVGVGSSSSTPTYEHMGLTLSQVRALSNLVGEYLYVRASFNVSSPGFDRAVLGNGSVSVR